MPVSKKPKVRYWGSASRRAKLKFKLRMQRGKIFKRRWAEERDFMLKCQAELIAANRKKWQGIRDATKLAVDMMPAKVPMADFRRLLKENIKAIRKPENRDSVDAKVVQKFVVRIRKYGLMTFDSETCTWTVAYPRIDDNVAP